MSRIDRKFKELRAQKKKAFIAFITAGYPNLATTEKLVLSFEKAGVDIIELGVPFSDPIADGATIQASSKYALDHGVTLKKILALVRRLRKKTEMPIALMLYYNQVFHFGEKKFMTACAQAGVDGLIIPDLPPEEAGALMTYAWQQDIATVFFVAPTTKPARIKKIAKASTGFIYYVSLTGVTGARTSLPKAVAKQVQNIKKISSKPVCVGFGISQPQHVRSMGESADGVIVGSAIVQKLTETRGNVPKVTQFVASLAKQLK